MVQQDLFVASSLAIAGGCCQVLAVLILAYPEFQKSRGVALTETQEKLLMPLNILFQIIVGVVNTASTWFGPVSIVIPMRVSSQLLFNMFFFESLGIEDFTKDVRIGTFIVVTATFILPVVGPTVQQGQDAVKLLEHWTSEVWALFLVVLTFVAGSYCIHFFVAKVQRGDAGEVEAEEHEVGADMSMKMNMNIAHSHSHSHSHDYKTFILLTARVTSAVLSTSISKLLVATTGYAFLLSVALFILCSVIISTVAILQATEVDQGSFVPASACGIQFVNAITGLIIWQDWKVVQSWSGYSLVMLQIVLGVYLIASIDEFSNSADADFSLTQSLTIQAAKGISRSRTRTLAFGDSMMYSFAGGNLNTMLQSVREDEDEMRRLSMTGLGFHNKYSSLITVPSGNNNNKTIRSVESTGLSFGDSDSESEALVSFATSTTTDLSKKKRAGILKKILSGKNKRNNQAL